MIRINEAFCEECSMPLPVAENPYIQCDICKDIARVAIYYARTNEEKEFFEKIATEYPYRLTKEEEMTHEERKEIYTLLRENYLHLNDVLEQICEDWQKIDKGEEYKKPDKISKIMLADQIKSEQDYKDAWRQFRLQQHEILKFFAANEMLHFWFEDNPNDKNHIFMGKFFIKPGPISHMMIHKGITKDEDGKESNVLEYISY